MTTRIAMDGFSRVRPINEGYVVKGGVNAASQIAVRPPAPAPMRPSALPRQAGSTQTSAQEK